MAIIRLEFDLERPEDEAVYRDYIDGPKMRAALQDFDNYLRSRMKYADLKDGAHNEIAQARNYLYQIADGLIWDD